MSTDEVMRRIQEALEQGATELDLSGCRLTTLPESIGDLTQLKKLDLRYNQLQSLPESIGNLIQLQTLSLGVSTIRPLFFHPL